MPTLASQKKLLLRIGYRPPKGVLLAQKGHRNDYLIIRPPAAA